MDASGGWSSLVDRESGASGRWDPIPGSPEADVIEEIREGVQGLVLMSENARLDRLRGRSRRL